MLVVLTAWRPGLQKISLSDLLRERAGWSLKQAKAAVDGLLDGAPIEVRLQSEEAAREFLRQAVELGAAGELRPTPP